MSASKKVEELSVAELRVMVDASRATWVDVLLSRWAPPRLIELRHELAMLETLVVEQAWEKLMSCEKRLAEAEEKL